MPYVSEFTRNTLESGCPPREPGELNYTITQAIIKYVQTKGLCYTTINDIMGALEGAKHEFYFRVAFPYECEKRRLNGDVYQGVTPGE